MPLTKTATARGFIRKQQHAAPAPGPAPVRSFTPAEFFDRFTDAEFSALLAEARTNATAAVWIERLKMLPSIRLDMPRIINAVNAMENAGIVSPGRASEILDNAQ